MNEYDTQLVKAILTKANYTFVPNEDESDIILLNTCAIRENAHNKVYGRVHSILHTRHKSQDTSHKTQNAIIKRPVLIGILGCMATNLRKELFENKNLKIDFIAGPDSYKRLPELISQASETGEKTFDLTLSEFETYSDVYPTREKGVNAWIAVMRGCNNFCTFCVVPYTRGRERSRSPENVVEEVKKLAQEGFRQVTLLGQNVNSYYYPFSKKMDNSNPRSLFFPEGEKERGADFADLLETVSRVEAIERIRFTSPHPKDFPEKLLRTIASNPKICKHIHLPLQAGNNRILNLMDRTYTQEEFLKLVEKIRKLIPRVTLSTDIIVGFSSETDEEFENTIKVIHEVQFDSAFIFKYSERKNTIASKKYPDDVPDEKKTERIVKLNEIQKEISLKKNRAHIGQTLDVLIEEKETPKSKNQFQGRSDGNKIVVFPSGPYQRGETIPVKIIDAATNCLKGIIS